MSIYPTLADPEYQGACSDLIGQTLVGEKGSKWTVLEKIQRKKHSSGGRFSVGFIVADEAGKKAFLKDRSARKERRP